MLLASLLLAAPAVIAISVPASDTHHDDHSVRRSLGARWYHEADHPVHNLFRRSGQTDGITYPVVGSLSECMLAHIRFDFISCHSVGGRLPERDPRFKSIA